MKKGLLLLTCLVLATGIWAQGINLPKPKAAPIPKANTQSAPSAPKTTEKKITLNLMWEGDKTVKISIGTSKFFCQPHSQQSVTIPYGNGFFAITVETPNQTGSAENFFNPESENGGLLSVFWEINNRYPTFRYESPSEIKEEEARKIREILEKQKQAQLNVISRAKYYLETGQCSDGLRYFNDNFNTNGPIKSNSPEVTTFLTAVEQCKKQQLELEISRKKQAQLAFIENCKALITTSNCTYANSKFETEFPSGPLTKQSPEAQEFYAKVKTCQENKKKQDIELQLSQQKQFLQKIETLINLRYCDSAGKILIKQLPNGPITSNSPEILELTKKIENCKTAIKNEQIEMAKEKQFNLIKNCESLISDKQCDDADKLYAKIVAMGPLTDKSPEIIQLNAQIGGCRNAIKQQAIDKQKQFITYANESLESGQCNQAEGFYNKALNGPLVDSDPIFVELYNKIKKCQVDIKFNEILFQYNTALNQYKYEIALENISEAKKLKPTDNGILEKFSSLNLKITDGVAALAKANLLYDSKKYGEAADLYEEIQQSLPFWDKIPADRMGDIMKKTQFQRLMLGYYAPQKDYSTLRKLADSCIAVDPTNIELKRISLNIDYQTMWNEYQSYYQKSDYVIAKTKLVAAIQLIASDSGSAAMKQIELKILEDTYNNIKAYGDNDSTARFILSHPVLNDSTNLETNQILANYYYNQISNNYKHYQYRKSLRKEGVVTDKILLLNLSNKINASIPNYNNLTQSKLQVLKLKRRFNNGLELMGGVAGFIASGNYVSDLSQYKNLEYPNPAKTLIDWKTSDNQYQTLSLTMNANIHHTWWKIKDNGKITGHYFDIHAGESNWETECFANAFSIVNMHDKFSELYQQQYPGYYQSICNTVLNQYYIDPNNSGNYILHDVKFITKHQYTGFNYGWRFPKSRQSVFVGADADMHYMDVIATNQNYPLTVANEQIKNVYVSPKITYSFGAISASYKPFNSSWLSITQNPLYSIQGNQLDVDFKFKITRWWKIGLNYSNLLLKQTYLDPLFTTKEITYLTTTSNINTQYINIQSLWLYTSICF